MFSNPFRKPRKETPEELKIRADKIRAALNPDYVEKLREYAAGSEHGHLKNLIEKLEMAATNPDMSDRFVVDTAQHVVRSLNTAKQPPRRLGFEVSENGRDFERMQPPADPQREDQAIQAKTLASNLSGLVPHPNVTLRG